MQVLYYMSYNKKLKVCLIVCLYMYEYARVCLVCKSMWSVQVSYYMSFKKVKDEPYRVCVYV